MNLDIIGQVCQQLGITLIITNNDDMNERINRNVDFSQLPVMLLRDDVGISFVFNPQTGMQVPVSTINIMLLTKPTELTQAGRVSSAWSMVPLFTDFIQRVSRDQGSLVKSQQPAIQNCAIEVVTQVKTSMHAGVVGDFSMLLEAQYLCPNQ